MPRPIRAPFTIPYGAQFGAIRARGARTHTGTDYHVPIGTPIYGTENGGRVTGRYFAAGGYGYYVTVVYPSGRTMDAHMREHSPLPVGTSVGINTVVGYVGLTGNAVNADPPGSHDHHERWNSAGARINPESRYRLEPAGNDPTPISLPTKENHMLVYKIVGGGLSGTLWGLAPGAMFNAADAASGLLMAKDWNPSGAPIDRSEAEVRKIAGYLGIPDYLIAMGMAGVNWSWAKDAVALAKPATTSTNAPLSDAELARIADAVRTRIIKE